MKAREVLRRLARRRDYPSEIAFWNEYLVSSEVLDAHIRREAFPQFLEPFIRQLGASPARVLELGSGPVSLLAWGVDHGIIEVTALDPLARAYEEMMQSHGYDYPVVPVEGQGEKLLKKFDRGEFDAAYSSNALDHTASPAACFRNLVDVVRPGGFVCVEGLEREGSSGGWQGLHQHDLVASEGHLWCTNRRGREVDITSGPDIACIYEWVGPFPERGLASHGYEYDPASDDPDAWFRRRWFSMIFRVTG